MLIGEIMGNLSLKKQIAIVGCFTIDRITNQFYGGLLLFREAESTAKL